MKILNKYDAIYYRKQIEKATTNLDDKNASKSTVLYPEMKYNGRLIAAGERINFGEVLYKAAVDLWDTEANNPENAPNLWEEIQYHNGVRIIPEVITVTTAFSKDELGYWKEDGNIYISKVNNNVYTPTQYADNWELKKV